MKQIHTHLGGESPSDDPVTEADGLFVFDVKVKGQDLNLKAVAHDFNATDKEIKKQLNRSYELYKLGVLKDFVVKDDASGTSLKSPESVQEYFSIIKKQSKDMTLESKLLLLSLWGNGLNNCYNKEDTAEDLDLQGVYSRARDGDTKTKCGVCRHIHRYTEELAQALGFKYAGQFTAISEKPASRREEKKRARHAVAYFVDGETGNYYIQNYSAIFNTRQKTLQGAIDIATRIVSTFSGPSEVQSQSDKVHIYLPRTERWFREKVLDVTNSNPVDSAVDIRIGASNSDLAIQKGKKIGKDGFIKAFALHSSFAGGDGKYDVVAVGLASKLSGTSELKISPDLLAKLGASFSAYAGGKRISVPKIDSLQQNETISNHSIIAGTELNGFAQIDPFTGKIRIRAFSHDGSFGIAAQEDTGLAPIPEIEPSIKYDTRKGLQIELSRRYELKNSQLWRPISSYGAGVAYDKVGLYVETHATGKILKAYLRLGSETFLLDGVHDLTAVGLKNKIEAGMGSKKLGEFILAFDASGIIMKKKDAFFDVPWHGEASATWRKVLRKAVEVGVTGSVSLNQPFFLFEEPGTVTPDFTPDRYSDASVMTWLKWHYDH